MAGDEREGGEVLEAFGPPLSGLQAAAALALGVASLLIAGVLPVVLAALTDEHRLSASGIGLAAMLEALTVGATTGLASSLLKPVWMKAIGFASVIALAALDLAVLGAHGGGVFLVRAVAGVPEGLLLWICIGMIARTVTPERWAAVFVTALTLAQFVLAAAMAGVVVPRFHANGGFALLAVVSLLFAPMAFFLPASYAPLPDTGRPGGLPPPRGWIALAACLLLGSASAAVAIYIVPLAQQAGLGAGVGGGANAVSLAAQVAGGAAAVVAAGRVRYFHVCVGGAIAYGAAWTVMGAHAPAWLFLAASAVFGFVLLFVGPFFVPMTIDADPTRRTAVQNGTAQVFGGALGPLLASLMVNDQSARGVLGLGGVLVAAGLVLIAYLHMTHKEAAPA